MSMVSIAHSRVYGLARTMGRGWLAALSILWAESHWGALIRGRRELLGGDKSLGFPHACFGHGSKESTGWALPREGDDPGVEAPLARDSHQRGPSQVHLGWFSPAKSGGRLDPTNSKQVLGF